MRNLRAGAKVTEIGMAFAGAFFIIFKLPSDLQATFELSTSSKQLIVLLGVLAVFFTFVISSFASWLYCVIYDIPLEGFATHASAFKRIAEQSLDNRGFRQRSYVAMAIGLSVKFLVLEQFANRISHIGSTHLRVLINELGRESATSADAFRRLIDSIFWCQCNLRELESTHSQWMKQIEPMLQVRPSHRIATALSVVDDMHGKLKALENTPPTTSRGKKDAKQLLESCAMELSQERKKCDDLASKLREDLCECRKLVTFLK